MVVFYDKSEFIETETGNKVSRKAMICGSNGIVVGGKTIIDSDCILRGDLRRQTTTTSAGGTTTTTASNAAAVIVIALGRYTKVGRGCIIKPPYKTYKNNFSYYPMKIADYVSIGENCVVEAASIGSCVEIGNNCVIGRFVIIKDCCRILDGAVIPPNTVVPSFSIIGGSSGKLVDELPESIQEYYEAKAKDYYYNKFVPRLN